MTISVLQNPGVVGKTTATTQTTTLPSLSQGSLLIMAVQTASTITCKSLKDGAGGGGGNVWHLLKTQNNGSSVGQLSLWACFSSRFSASTVTFTATLSATGVAALNVLEVGGWSNYGFLDLSVIAGAAGTAATITTAGGTTNDAVEFVYSTAGVGTTGCSITANGAYTSAGNGFATGCSLGAEYLVTSSAGAQATNLSITNTAPAWANIIVAFRQTTFACLQFKQFQPNSGATWTGTFDIAVSTGSLLALGGGPLSTATALSSGSVADSVNGAWTKTLDDSDNFASMFHRGNSASGSPTVTVTLGTADTGAFWIAEFAGVLAATSPFDVKAAGTPASMTTTANPELLVAVCDASGTIAEPGISQPYFMFAIPTTTNAIKGGAWGVKFVTGVQTSVWSPSSNGVEAAFKIAATGATDPFPLVYPLLMQQIANAVYRT